VATSAVDHSNHHGNFPGGFCIQPYACLNARSPPCAGAAFPTVHQKVGFAPKGCKATMRYTGRCGEQMLGDVS
jgi:hypothetical protein